MNGKINLACICAVALLMLGGCGDDGGSPDAGPAVVDQCLNPADTAIAGETQSWDGGVFIPDSGPDNVSLGDYYGACSTSDCLEHIVSQDLAAMDACMVDCLMGTPAEGLSQGCRDCYNEFVTCVALECVSVCIVDEQSPACIDCYENSPCIPSGEECTGLAVL